MSEPTKLNGRKLKIKRGKVLDHRRSMSWLPRSPGRLRPMGAKRHRMVHAEVLPILSVARPGTGRQCLARRQRPCRRRICQNERPHLRCLDRGRTRGCTRHRRLQWTSTHRVQQGSVHDPKWAPILIRQRISETRTRTPQPNRPPTRLCHPCRDEQDNRDRDRIRPQGKTVTANDKEVILSGGVLIRHSF